MSEGRAGHYLLVERNYLLWPLKTIYKYNFIVEVSSNINVSLKRWL